MHVNGVTNMFTKIRNINWVYITPASGIAGCLVIVFGLVASASHYTRAMPYSPKNHFISELGLATASQYSFVFNICLGIGGLLLMLFTNGLGIYLRQVRLAWYASYIGMAATLSFSAIGYYTADSWTAHRNAAMVFFSGVMVSIVLFSYCVWQNKSRSMHHFITVQGFLIALIYVVVLAWPKDKLIQSVEDPANFIRPELWGLTVLEWLYCGMIGSWILAVSVDMIYVIRKANKAKGNSLAAASEPGQLNH